MAALLNVACDSSPPPSAEEPSPEPSASSPAKMNERRKKELEALRRRRSLPRRYRIDAIETAIWTTPHSRCGERIGAPPAGSTSRVLFFSCVRKNQPLIPAAPARALAKGTNIDSAIRNLLRGPTKDEKRAGFTSNFDEKTGDIRFSLRREREHDLLVIDFERAILDVEFVFVSTQDVGQLAATVGQFPEVDWILIRVGGKRLCAVLGEC